MDSNDGVRPAAPPSTAAAPSAPEPAVDAPSRRMRPRSRNRTLFAIGGAAGVAVLGATASAVITPERIDDFFGTITGGTAAPPSTAPADPVEYKTVVSNDRAITVDVPSDWGANLARWDATADPGSALRTGNDTTEYVDHEVDGGWLGASMAAARAADVGAMNDAGRADWMRSYIEVDWTIEGCVREPDPQWDRPGWRIEATRWKDCASFDGHRFFEFAAIDDEGEVFVLAQVSLVADTPDEVIERFVQSFVVSPALLPRETIQGDDVITP